MVLAASTNRVLEVKEMKQTFFLSHFLEVIFSHKRDSGFGFVWSLLLHVDLKVLLSVPERSLLWAVLTARRGTLWGQVRMLTTAHD